MSNQSSVLRESQRYEKPSLGLSVLWC